MKTLLQKCDEVATLLASSQNLVHLISLAAKELAITPNSNEKLIRSRLEAAGVHPLLADKFVARFKAAQNARPVLDNETMQLVPTAPETCALYRRG